MSKNKQSKHHSIYNVVRRIPEGRVATYGFVACKANIGDPKTFGRIVADAMMAAEAIELHVDAVRKKIWWWRVIKKHPSGEGYGIIAPEAPEEQRIRLKEEGVQFDANGRVDLARFGWDGTNTQPPKPEKPMKLNKFYIALAVMVAWVIIGLIFVAPWLFATFDVRTAFTYDLLGLIMPFVALSVYVIAQSHQVRWFVSVPVIVVIVALWLLTARNIVVIIRDYL